MDGYLDPGHYGIVMIVYDGERWRSGTLSDRHALPTGAKKCRKFLLTRRIVPGILERMDILPFNE